MLSESEGACILIKIKSLKYYCEIYVIMKNALCKLTMIIKYSQVLPIWPPNDDCVANAAQTYHQVLGSIPPLQLPWKHPVENSLLL
jgi:hypothetical protein